MPPQTDVPLYIIPQRHPIIFGEIVPEWGTGQTHYGTAAWAPASPSGIFFMRGVRWIGVPSSQERWRLVVRGGEKSVDSERDVYLPSFCVRARAAVRQFRSR